MIVSSQMFLVVFLKCRIKQVVRTRSQKLRLLLRGKGACETNKFCGSTVFDVYVRIAHVLRASESVS